MPIYEYECKKCGEINEVLQKTTDPAPKICEQCGAKQLTRVMSQSSFVLKGEGWYVTEYGKGGSKDKKPTAKKPSNDASGGSSDTKGKSDTKKAASAD